MIKVSTAAEAAIKIQAKSLFSALIN